MNLIAAANLGNYIWLMFALACPLMMVFMMRGMHGGQGGGHQGTANDAARSRARMSLDELKRERDELNALIGERAADAVEAKR